MGPMAQFIQLLTLEVKTRMANQVISLRVDLPRTNTSNFKDALREFVESQLDVRVGDVWDGEDYREQTVSPSIAYAGSENVRVR